MPSIIWVIMKLTIEDLLRYNLQYAWAWSENTSIVFSWIGLNNRSRIWMLDFFIWKIHRNVHAWLRMFNEEKNVNRCKYKNNSTIFEQSLCIWKTLFRNIFHHRLVSLVYWNKTNSESKCFKKINIAHCN